MFSMFEDKYPLVKVSYQTYREIFKRDFNLSFGYPRSDTCSQCDEFNAKMKAIQTHDGNENREFEELKSLKELHLRKAQAFMIEKRHAKERQENKMILKL